MKNSGLTLIEILVVIVIISILASVLTLSASSFVDGQRYKNTEGLINALDAGCQKYKNHFNKYPSESVTVNAQIVSGSKALHYHLGRSIPKIDGDIKSGERDPFV